MRKNCIHIGNLGFFSFGSSSKNLKYKLKIIEGQKMKDLTIMRQDL
jgi:hypothetical protein